MLCIDTLLIEEAATGMDEWFSHLELMVVWLQGQANKY